MNLFSVFSFFQRQRGLPQNDVFQIFHVYEAGGHGRSTGLQPDNKTAYGSGNDDDQDRHEQLSMRPGISR